MCVKDLSRERKRGVRVLMLKMMEVILHVYDVTNSESDKTNSTIVQINKIFKDGIGLGGIFHSAVQVSSFSLLFFFFISFML